MSDEHCKDCCCERAWKALGISEYTGKSIPEHIAILTARLAAAEALLREAAIQWELGVDTCGMRQVRLPKEWYARTLKTGGVRPAPAAKGVGRE